MFRSEPINPKRESSFQVYFSDWTTWWNYFQTYADVFEATVKRVEAGEQFNHQALPALFLMRHTLELGLKAQIRKFETVNTAAEIQTFNFTGASHKLSVLLPAFERHIRLSIQKVNVDEKTRSQLESYGKKIRSLQDIIDTLDSDSQSFRFPTTKDGAPYWTRKHDTNVAKMINLYFDIKPFIYFTDQVFAHLGLFADVEFEAEMRSRTTE